MELQGEVTLKKIAECQEQINQASAGLQANDGALQALRALEERLTMWERGGKV